MLIFCGIFSESNPKCFSSISTKTGVALTKRTEFAVEINENDGIIISSPSPNPYAKRVACSADVPEFTATQ